MPTTIPAQILSKTEAAVSFHEIQNLGFPIPDMETYILSDPDEIKARQSVFRDVFEYPELLEKYEKLSGQMEVLSGFFQKAGDDRDNEAIIYSLIKMQSFTEIIDYIVTDLLPLTVSKMIKAQPVVDFINACAAVSEDESYKNVKGWLGNLDVNLKNIKSVTLGVNLDAQLKVSEIGVASFNTSPYVGSGVINSMFRDENPSDEYKCMISLGVYETKKLLGRSIISVNNELFNAMNTIYRGLLKKIRRDILNLFKQEAVSLAGVASDMEFVTKSCRYMMSLKEQGGVITFPRISSCHKIRGLYNPNILYKVGKKRLVANDVEMDEDNRIFILTGPNSGGKSVYLNSLGIAQLLFQLGLPVPAADAEMKPFKTIAAMGVKSAEKTNDGRLANEVTRLKECLQALTDSTLILLDETFSSTSAFDGVFLAESLIKYLANRGCYTVYVTHFHELSQRIKELNKDGYSIHMLTAQNIDGRRTYKIVQYEGYDSDKSLAKDIVIENGLGFLFE